MQRLTMDETKAEKRVNIEAPETVEVESPKPEYSSVKRRELPEVPEVPELKLEFEKPVVEEKTETPEVNTEYAIKYEIETEEEALETPLFAELPDIDELSKTLEAMLFVSKDPLKPEKIKQVLGLTSIIPIRQAMDKLQNFYEESGRAYELREIAEGYLLQTRTNYDNCIQKLRKAKRELKITQNALTTLSIVAYKQPITRSEVDSIRGANSSHHMRTLIENELIKVVGKKEAPGSPRLYGTTRRFLEIFGLKSTSGLPKSTEAFEEKIKTKAKPEEETTVTEEVEAEVVVEETLETDQLREITGKKREIIDPDEFN